MHYPSSNAALAQSYSVPPPPINMDKPATSLDISLNQMDEQLSRFYNYMNELDRLAEVLKANDQGMKTDGPSPIPAPPKDHCGKLSHYLDTFNHLNNRLEATVGYLGRAI